MHPSKAWSAARESKIILRLVLSLICYFGLYASDALDPDLAELALPDPTLAPYDDQHRVIYLRMLDANAGGADWREVPGIVLHIDAELEPDRARRAFDSHVARAKWTAASGCRRLLRWD
jgi:hypothetical protein